MFLEDGLFSFNNSNNRTKHFLKKIIQLDIPSYKTKIIGLGDQEI